MRKSDNKIVGACVKVSSGCAHCYSEKISLRFDRGKLYNAANMEELEPVLDERELRQLATKQSCQGELVAGRRVFVGDMTDAFGEWVPESMLDLLFATMAIRADVTFQVLTKRAERARAFMDLAAARMRESRVGRVFSVALHHPWPPPNVWLGVSVENQVAAEERIPHLLQTPAAVRFVSYEPALGPVDFSVFLSPALSARSTTGGHNTVRTQLLHWIICGGESGPGKRPFDPDWARSVRDQCREAKVPFFMKQFDKVQPIPADLLVREFP